jgi:hypothetical protein
MAANDRHKQVRWWQWLRTISALVARRPGKVGQAGVAFPDKVGREWRFATPVAIPGGNRAGNDTRLLLGLVGVWRMFLALFILPGYLRGCWHSL